MAEDPAVENAAGRATPIEKPSPATPADDVDHQFRALMEGLRTTIPGMMVLFAFLLTLPLQRNFGSLSRVDRAAFYVAFFSSAVSALLLIAPSVHQRLRAPISGIRRRTVAHVMTAVKIAIAGTVTFLVAIVAVVYLVSSLVLSPFWASLIAASITLVAVWTWFYLPLVRFQRGADTQRPSS